MIEKQITYHKSVLTQEVLQTLDPQPGKVYLDVTFGGGGHTRAILDAEPGCSVVAIDWDMKAVEQNSPPLIEQYGERFKILWGNFGQLYKILKKAGIKQVDGILADFGTSQFQIHEKEGFSFRKDTPLDMRMSHAHQHITAATIVNNASELELVKIFSEYGQEPMSRTIARKIVEVRKITPLRTTHQLAELIEKVASSKGPKSPRRIHPATRVFQALRIAVNHELDNIHSFLIAATRFLSPQGRLVCISFHSLEDRMVKQFFKDQNGVLEILTPRPLTASDEELAQNLSSRSAKLRAARKIG